MTALTAVSILANLGCLYIIGIQQKIINSQSARITNIANYIWPILDNKEHAEQEDGP